MGTVYRDRSAWLLLFGVVEILLGLAVAALLPALMVAVSRHGGAAGVDAGSTAAVVALHVVVGAAFIVLGFGSIRARRWARVVWISVSWIWLLTGVLSLLLSGLVLPALLRVGIPGPYPGAAGLLMGAAVLAVLAIIYVAAPAALLLFYRSRHVEATCRARGPERQWTDGIPPPVVTLTILWVVAAASVAVMPAYNWIMPAFGVLLADGTGAMAWAVVGAACLLLAVGSARQRRWAWTGALVLTAAAALSSLVTFLRFEPAAVVAAMDLPGDQAALMAGLGSVGRWPAATFWMLVWGSFIVYLWRLRGCFPAHD